MKLNAKLARQIAMKSFAYVVDCVMGATSDDTFNFGNDATYFEVNFYEDLEELGIKPTRQAIENVKSEYEKLRIKAQKAMLKLVE